MTNINIILMSNCLTLDIKMLNVITVQMSNVKLRVFDIQQGQDPGQNQMKVEMEVKVKAKFKVQFGWKSS